MTTAPPKCATVAHLKSELNSDLKSAVSADLGLDRVLFRRRLQRFWCASNWEPVGGWKPGEKVQGHVDDQDGPELPPMLAVVQRVKKR